LCYVGNRELGISGRELSEYLGISRAGVSQNIDRAGKLSLGKIENLII
jgi:DNA-binding MarR family transcriptional regulator